APAGVEPAAQPRHLAVLVEHPVGSVRLHLGDDQPHRVGADVDRRETRRRRRDGPSGSGGRSACRGGYARLGCRACHAAGSLWGERNGAASRSRQCATGFKDITVVSGWRRHLDRKSTRLNSSHVAISYAVFCLKKKKVIKIKEHKSKI